MKVDKIFEEKQPPIEHDKSGFDHNDSQPKLDHISNRSAEQRQEPVEPEVQQIYDDSDLLQQSLILDSDIYSHTFHQFVKNHDPVVLLELLTLCLVSFVIQLAIVIYKYKEALKDGREVYIGDCDLNMTRLVSAYIIHLYFYPEIQRALQMLNYAICKPSSFCQESCIIPNVIASCKLLSSLVIELSSIFLIVTFKSITEVILGYITCAIIFYIPYIMA